MVNPLTRPSTPPPADKFTNAQLNRPATDKLPVTPQKREYASDHQLLTPPSTEKSSRAVRFNLGQSTPTLSRRCLLRVEKEDEAALAQYLELDGSVSSADTSGSEELLLNENSSSLSFQAQVSQSGLPSDTDHTKLTQRPGVVSGGISATPFPFMNLPLSIRKKVYETLLVVPGLICVRQNHTSYHNEEKAYLYAETRQLLPGNAYALPQLSVNGSKIRFSCFPFANAAVLRVSKEVYNEAKPIMSVAPRAYNLLPHVGGVIGR